MLGHALFEHATPNNFTLKRRIAQRPEQRMIGQQLVLTLPKMTTRARPRIVAHPATAPDRTGFNSTNRIQSSR